MSGLLVSVRSVAEAAAALEGGADLIDVKEPAHGSLGPADDAVVADIVAHVAGRRPVSAAQGELRDQPDDQLPAPPPTGLAFVKWGLAGCQLLASWPDRLARIQATCTAQVVFVAYADWQCAQAPPVDAVLDAACRRSGNILLVDTHCKDPASLRRERRPTLLDWLSLAEVESLCRRCRDAGVRIALAGSLGPAEMAALHPLQPDWFAVRGAACEAGDRTASVSARRVRELAASVAAKRC